MAQSDTQQGKCLTATLGAQYRWVVGAWDGCIDPLKHRWMDGLGDELMDGCEQRLEGHQALRLFLPPNPEDC